MLINSIINICVKTHQFCLLCWGVVSGVTHAEAKQSTSCYQTQSYTKELNCTTVIVFSGSW